MELIQADVPTEELEAEFIQLRRRRALTARGMVLAEEMLETADERHRAVTERLAAVEACLELRYFDTAAAVGVTEEQAPAVLTLE